MQSNPSTALAALLACAAASLAQEAPRDATGRATELLKKHDTLRGAGAAELLLADRSLDAAIGELARTKGTERIVQQRALRLWRAIAIADRVRDGLHKRDAAWWLAFAELANEMPDVESKLLLARAFADPKALTAAETELAAATATAKAFCTEWNEDSPLGDGDKERAERARYQQLEAALKKAGPAAVPHLLDVLAVLPVLSFTDEEPVSARRQVRAIFALAVHLDLPDAMPCYVMHAAGPSLTQTSNAASAAQKFAHEDFGAGLLRPGNEEALLAWWTAHRAEHEIVLDHLVHEVVRLARGAMEQPGNRGTNACWATPRVLDRLLGDVAIPSKDAGREVLHACVQLAEDDWLAHRAAAGAAPNARTK